MEIERQALIVILKSWLNTLALLGSNLILVLFYSQLFGLLGLNGSYFAEKLRLRSYRHTLSAMLAVIACIIFIATFVI